MKRLFYLVVVLQLLFLVAQAANNEIALRAADIVYLRMVPVDPRSLFMGNYMDLNYDISSIDLSHVRVLGSRSNYNCYNATIFAGLRPSKPFAKLVAVSNRMPSNPSGLVWLRGTVSETRDHNPRIEYGLERYYIPEGKEDEVARLPWGREGRQRQITVEVAVRGDGTGFIRKVLVDGKPLPF